MYLGCIKSVYKYIDYTFKILLKLIKLLKG
jgi:hypothetical protein